MASARKPVEKTTRSHAVAHEVLEDVGDERPSDDRSDRLGHPRGDRPQTRALAADEDDGLQAGASGHAGGPMP